MVSVGNSRKLAVLFFGGGGGGAVSMYTRGYGMPMYTKGYGMLGVERERERYYIYGTPPCTHAFPDMHIYIYRDTYTCMHVSVKGETSLLQFPHHLFGVVAEED